MRISCCFLSVWVLVFLATGSAVAGEDSLGTPHITVNGTARKEVVPDRLQWSLRVENSGLDLAKVAEEHTKRVEALLELLRSKGLSGKDVQTSQMEFSEKTVYRNHTPVKEGYIASTNVAFRLDDLGQYKPLWLRLAQVEGVSVVSASFDHSKRVELNKETRMLALRLAKDKAEVMAAALGSSVGEPLAITEDLSVSEGWGGSRVEMNNRVVQAQPEVQGGEGDGVLAPGTIPILIRVRVTFRLVTPAR